MRGMYTWPACCTTAYHALAESLSTAAAYNHLHASRHQGMQVFVYSCVEGATAGELLCKETVT